MSRVAIVVVSHSPALAQAALDLALEMVPEDPPSIVLAAGTADGGIGTDAMAVAEAIGSVGPGSAGVLVLMDLGSAVLSAEMALEFSDVDVPVRLTSAPFVEGLLAAVVSAAAGSSLEAVEREARQALSAKGSHLGEGGSDAPPAVELDAEGPTIDVEVLNRDGLHARPAAQLVAEVGRHDAELVAENLTRAGDPVAVTGTTALLAMGGRQGESIRLRATGLDAAALLASVQAMFAAGFGESLDQAEPVRAATRTGPIGVSAGRASGRVFRMPAPVEAPPATPVVPGPEREAEAERIATVAARVAEDLRHRAGSATGQAREILEAAVQVVTDDGVIADAGRRVRHDGLPPSAAVWEEFGVLAEALRAQGGRAAERAADLEDARARLVAGLTGHAVPELPAGDEPYVLVAHDLAPADTVLLDPATCLALVTEEGGPTSHTAIIARSLGIPAVVAARGAWADPGGEVLLVDGATGELVWDPSPEQVAAVGERAAPTAFSGAGATADGHPVALLANVGSADDARVAAKVGAEGIGLFRTELLFLGRDEAPTVDEQVAAYRAVLAAFPGRRVVVRTLDAGSDKPLAFVTTPDEENPALGVRGYRTADAHPALLADQLRAIAQAASQEQAEVAVMAPMVATVEEAADFAALARSLGLDRAGVMVETPSAALVADRLLGVVDFVSLGTNDLTQYTMAADRLVGALAPLNDPWAPAVLDLVGRVGAAGGSTGVPVGVCGEAASDPLLAAVLVGLGVTSLSMSARAIPAVAEQLARVTVGQCRAAASLAVAARSAHDARTAALAALGD